jgi:hypothetical protein
MDMGSELIKRKEGKERKGRRGIGYLNKSKGTTTQGLLL